MVRSGGESERDERIVIFWLRIVLATTMAFMLPGHALAECSGTVPMPPFVRLPNDTRMIEVWQDHATRSVSWSAFVRSSRLLNGHDPHGFAQIFEAQLGAAGWHEMEADTSDGVFMSSWNIAAGCGNAMGMLNIMQRGKGYYFVEIRTIRFPDQHSP